MIFKTLFRPKYKHKDPTIRIQALHQLDPSMQQNLSILHELAFNDSHVGVSLAALEKLNNFDLWWKVAATASDKRIVKKARRKVEGALLGKGELPISDTIKRSFIMECQDVALLEHLFLHNGIDASDTQMMLRVLRRLGKPQFNMRVLLATTNPSLQTALLEELHTEPELNRLLKRASDPHLISLVDSKLETIRHAQQKPSQISKATTLLLSKILALLDDDNWQTFVQRRQQLDGEFLQLQADFSCLNANLRADFEKKYNELTVKLDRKLAILEERWLANRSIAQQKDNLLAAQTDAKSVLAKVEEALSTKAASVTLGDLETYVGWIAQSKEKLIACTSMDLADTERHTVETLIRDLQKCSVNTDKLPALQTAIAQADALVHAFQRETLPSSMHEIAAAQATIDSYQMQWRNLQQPFHFIWPQALQKAWQLASKEWQQAIRRLQREAEQAQIKCRNKMSGLLRHIDGGRYKLALRHCDQAMALFTALPESERDKLQRQYQKFSAEVARIKGWQVHIAKPKRPLLLADIEQLVRQPLAPEEQAAQVKQIRRQWLELGQLNDDADDDLNDAFNAACEAAFEPCRQFYAQREAIRKANFNTKLSLLAELEQLATADISSGELEKSFSNIAKQWRAVGEVDYALQDDLNSRYQTVVEPIKTRVEAFYASNAEQKQALIVAAERLLAEDDWRDAVMQAKELQHAWRKISHSGVKSDKILWGKFRAINDQLFAKRTAAMNALQEVQTSTVTALRLQLENVAIAVNQAVTPLALESIYSTNIAAIEERLRELPKPLAQELRDQLDTLQQDYSTKLQLLRNAREKQHYYRVFEILEQFMETGKSDQIADLPGYWRSAFQLSFQPAAGYENYAREELLVLLEIEFSAPSPAESERLRKQLQLQLMAVKLAGDPLLKDELLRTWIGTAGLDFDGDSAAVMRLKALFL